MEERINIIQKIGNWVASLLLGNTRELIARIDERTNLMRGDLKEIKPVIMTLCQKVDEISPKVDILWKDRIAPAHSHRQLNEQGNSILEKSGIKEIVCDKKDYLFNLVKDKKDQNAYDAEATILSVMMDLPNNCPDIVEKLKTGAFNTGSSIDDVLLVGAIYLRNLIFSDLGFNIQDLDKPKS